MTTWKLKDDPWGTEMRTFACYGNVLFAFRFSVLIYHFRMCFVATAAHWTTYGHKIEHRAHRRLFSKANLEKRTTQKHLSTQSVPSFKNNIVPPRANHSLHAWTSELLSPPQRDLGSVSLARSYMPEWIEQLLPTAAIRRRVYRRELQKIEVGRLGSLVGSVKIAV